MSGKGGWHGEPRWRRQQSPLKGEHGGAKGKAGAWSNGIHIEGGGGVGDRHAMRKEGEGVRRRQDVPTGEAGGGRCGAAA
jgi:hypothetical protein